MQEYYKILGLSQGASEEEVENAYKELKAKYSKERFLEGEAGNEAAKNLTKLETAYAEIKASFKSDVKDSFFNGSLDRAEKLLKEGRINEAQAELDNATDRDAEWHYLQSVIFYKKNWFNESKKQLEIAMDIDPKNSKYSDAYTKLKQKMEFTERQFYSGNQGYANNGAGQQRQMGAEGTNDCLTFCATWCCMDMMCSMCCR